MVHIKNLNIYFDELHALQNISLELEPGIIYGLIGPNGAGKSTLLRSCAGLIEPDSGQIFFADKNIYKNRNWHKQICAYAPEDVELMPYLKGNEFLQLIAKIRKIKNPESEINKFLELLGLSEKKNELIVEMSHGMRQKVSVAAALLSKANYLIFDETLNGFDTPALNKLHSYLNEYVSAGNTLILSSHILTLTQDWCQQIIMLDQGTVAGRLTKAEVKNWSAESYPFPIKTMEK